MDGVPARRSDCAAARAGDAEPDVPRRSNRHTYISGDRNLRAVYRVEYVQRHADWLGETYAGNLTEFQKIRRDENLVTLAGLASNLLLVLIAFLVLVFIAIVFPGGHDIVRSPFQLGESGGVFSAVQAVAS